MEKPLFVVQDQVTKTWQPVPHVSEAQMRRVDQIAVEEFQLGILQMMENAGRSLAILAYRYLQGHLPGGGKRTILVAAGSGGNGGGGLCAARHLHNWGVAVRLVLTKAPEEMRGAARHQLEILRAAGLTVEPIGAAGDAAANADLVLDAVIGYSLKGAPQDRARMLIGLINQCGKPVISLDLPSGLDATSAEPPGECVKADQTLSLALPKAGLTNPLSGELYLADIGIPPEVYLPLGIHFEPFFGNQSILRMRVSDIEL